ncbi:MAG: sensor histidine kinase [Balneolaceae bacterium]|nr:sensor histidine kinase [Balneolaceae bacterium]
MKNGTIQWDTLIVDITDEVRQQQVNETLVQEIHHRVKNNLAIIIGFLELQLEDLNEQSPERLTLERAMTRIYSIAEIHKLLHEGSNLVDINVKKYMDHLIEHITDTINVGDGLHVDLQVDRLQMNVNELTPLGMLLSELLTNSAKYALNRNKRGHIQINISSLNGSYNVRYHDTGPGIDKLEFENPKDTDFNIVHLLLRQLEADYKLLNKDGFGLEFTFKERQKGAHSNIGI